MGMQRCERPSIALAGVGYERLHVMSVLSLP